MSAIKKIAKKSRDKLFGDITHRMEGINVQLATISHAQLEINHNQMVILRELDKRTKNSGNMYLSDREMATKLFSGLKMYLDPQDLTLAVHLALDSIWESNITAAWLQVVKPGDTVIDIGANFGYYGALAAEKNKGNGLFVFFEANPHLIPYIRKTLAANWVIDSCKVENAAVSNKNGEVILSVSPNYLGNASLRKVTSSHEYDQYRIYNEELEPKKVQAVTLDAYCKANKIDHLDLIKMDIEGFEDKAYEGMQSIIKASPNVSMFIEFTKDAYKKPQNFYKQLLKDFGHIYTIDQDGRILKPEHTDYEHIIGGTEGWTMPIFSKNPNLVSS